MTISSFMRKLVLLAVFGIVIGPWYVQAADSSKTAESAVAMTTIDGAQLPPPDPKFEGVIKQTALDSEAWWAPRVVPPQEAPNVFSSSLLMPALVCQARLAASSQHRRWTAWQRAA